MISEFVAGTYPPKVDWEAYVKATEAAQSKESEAALSDASVAVSALNRVISEQNLLSEWGSEDCTIVIL